MNRSILRLALPNIITNITVPLLGMVDMAIVGHLSSSHIGAIAIGTSIFNLIYWNFGFLRMGTSGFTAQAYGARKFDEVVRVLLRAATIALAIAIILIVLQRPIATLAKAIFNGSDTVMSMAISYFFIRVWAAPATLGLYAVKGWFIGMQNSKLPMWIAIFINVVNILCSLLFVLVLHWDIRGVALGTVIAQYSGLTVGLFFLFHNYGKMLRRHIDKNFIRNTLRWNEMKHFFKVNGDIFLRTVCLAAVFTFITAESGRLSDDIMAIDALLLQFFTLFSYIMDGFAYAGESLVGRFIGARDRRRLVLSVRCLLAWGMLITVIFTVAYALFGQQFLMLFSNDKALVASARPYMFWTQVIPVCGFAAFLFDGIFVGATASRTMRNSMFLATAAFFGIYYGLSYALTISDTTTQNNILWTSFMVYLATRGIAQGIMVHSEVYGRIPNA